MTIEDIRQLVLKADPNASHYESTEKGTAYTTWHEFDRDPLWGDNDTAEDGWRFQVDRFTKLDTDPMVDTIWQTMKAEPRVAVEHIVMPDPGTEYVHHVFSCRGR